MKKWAFSNKSVFVEQRKKHGHLASKGTAWSIDSNFVRPVKRKGLTDQEVNHMRVLDTFVKTSDDFFDCDPYNLEPNSDVDEDVRPTKRAKISEDKYIEFSSSTSTAVEGGDKILKSVLAKLRQVVQANQGSVENSESVMHRRRLLFALEEFYKRPDEPEQDMDVDAKEESKGSQEFKLEHQQADELAALSKPETNAETCLHVRACGFNYEWGVNSMAAEVIEGTGELGAGLKGQKVKLLLPPDFITKNAKVGNRYEIMSPTIVSERVLNCPIENLIIWREARLSMIKEETVVTL